MSILINKKTRVMVQGITGREGRFHTERMLDYGTKVVAGVTPGKGGTAELEVPVYNSVEDVLISSNTGRIDACAIFVPPMFAADAICEAVDCGIDVIVCITEGIPTLDMVRVRRMMKGKKSILIGPNCPGVITPGESKVGIMPGDIHKTGRIGVISRSGTLTYEVVDQLSSVGLGQSSCVGIGGDPVIGMNFVDILKVFKEDEQTDGVVIIGEIGGEAEEEAADYISSEFDKPVLAFIAGKTAPAGKRMGHAGAIISGGRGRAEDKISCLKRAGVEVVLNPAAIGEAARACFSP